MKVELLTFEKALELSTLYSKRHLLLGNGFSIECRPEIFRYDQLFKRTSWEGVSDNAKESFSSLATNDFERVIKALRDSATLSQLYGLNSNQVQIMRKDADALKELLVKTIASNHPKNPSEITDAEYSSCQKFLKHFNKIYTLNYDLLLYWTHMHREDETHIQSDDGFRTSQEDIDSGNESDYVVWEPGQSRKQNIWFLHGALHIFDSGTEIQKYTWVRTGICLIEQIREALNKNFFPLFVAEGTTQEKLERVKHSDYLAKAYRSFQEIGGCLFIFGHSLAENDEHYLKLIERGNIIHLFVGLYGNPKGDENQSIIKRAELMTNRRSNKKSPLEVSFFNSSTAHVWR